MTYKGYRILVNFKVTKFFEFDDYDEETALSPFPELGDQVTDINYDSGDDGEYWFSVVDKEGWVTMSFESLEECKQYIDEEVAK